MPLFDAQGLEQRNEKRFAHLLNTMSMIDVPTARPSFARYDEATGLALLSLSLKLSHVHRVTESLRLINTDHLSRSVSLDVDLRKLTASERRSLRVHALVEGTHQSGGDEPRHLWVPISRHSREDLAPVVVRNASDDVVPRLTQVAATNAVIAGVTRLFRLQLNARWMDQTTTAELRDHRDRELDQRARWLTEAAIARLIEHGSHGQPPQRVGRGALHYGHERTIARNHLLSMPDDQAQSFAELVTVASREYFLVVMLPDDEPHHYLTYDAPLIPAVKAPARERRAWRSALPVSTEFTVDYLTQIPRSVASYHVTIEVPEEIDVRRFILSSNNDQPAVEDLATLVEALTERGTAMRCHPRVLERERDEALTALGVLAQRRRLDVQNFEYYLNNRDVEIAGDSLIEGDHRQIRAAGSELPSLAGLIGVRADVEKERETVVSRVHALLSRVPANLRANQLGYDVSTDNDPRENGAHAQWRPVSLGFGTPNVEPVQARVYLAMADEPPALVESVAWMIAALWLVVLGVGLAAGHISRHANEPPWLIDVGQADAIVAVLLIVPGILLTRLDIPSTHSVLGRLRVFPRGVAYLSVAATTGLAVMVSSTEVPAVDPAATDAAQRAAVVAARNAHWVLFISFVVCTGTLLVLFLLCLIERYARSLRRQVLVPASRTIPEWLRAEFAAQQRPSHRWVARLRRGRRTLRQADVYFDAIRPVPNAPRTAKSSPPPSSERHSEQLDEPVMYHGQGPARLAELAAVAVANDFTAAELQVVHGTRLAPSELGSQSDELLFVATDVGGCEVQLHALASGHSGASESGTKQAPGAPPQGRWTETAPYSPVLRRINKQDLDFIVDFSHLSGGAADTFVLDFLTGVWTSVEGADAVTPRLVQYPAAPPWRVPDADGAGNRDARRLPAGQVMRLSFAVDSREHDVRLQFESALLRLAEAHKVALYRASRRTGSGQGTWEAITCSVALAGSSNEASPMGLSAPMALSAPRTRTSAQVPATFVGRRNAGSLKALRSLTATLRCGGLQLTALTAAPLGPFVVVHVVAAALAGSEVKEPTSTDGLAAGMRLLRQAGALPTLTDHDLERIEQVDRFRTYVGCTHAWARSDPTRCNADERALWIAWDMPIDAISDGTLAALALGRCRAVMGSGRILYWRSYRVSPDRVVGRARFAVVQKPDAPCGPDGRERSIGDQAKEVQSRLFDRVAAEARERGVPKHAMSLHVTWSEEWLARERGL